MESGSPRNMEGHQRGGVVLIVALLMLVSMPYSSIAAEQDGSCCSSQEFDLFLIGSADDGSLSPFDSDLDEEFDQFVTCLLYTSPSPRDQRGSRMPSSA